MTNTNTEAVEALDAQRAIDPQTHSLVIAIEQAIAWFDDYAQSHAAKAQEAVAVDDIEAASRQAKARTNAYRAEYLRAALSPTAKTEPSAAGTLEDRLSASDVDESLILWLANERYKIDEEWAADRQEGGDWPRPRNYPHEVLHLIAALSAPTRERELGADRIFQAIHDAMQDEIDGKPCGCIIEKGCEAAGYCDPESAADAFKADAATRIDNLLNEGSGQ